MAFGLCLVLLLGILPFPDGMGGSVEMGKITAEAVVDAPPFLQTYYFSLGNGKYIPASGDSSYHKMTDTEQTLQLYVSKIDGAENPNGNPVVGTDIVDIIL